MYLINKTEKINGSLLEKYKVLVGISDKIQERNLKRDLCWWKVQKAFPKEILAQPYYISIVLRPVSPEFSPIGGE